MWLCEAVHWQHLENTDVTMVTHPIVVKTLYSETTKVTSLWRQRKSYRITKITRNNHSCINVVRGVNILCDMGIAEPINTQCLKKMSIVCPDPTRGPTLWQSANVWAERKSTRSSSCFCTGECSPATHSHQFPTKMTEKSYKRSLEPACAAVCLYKVSVWRFLFFIRADFAWFIVQGKLQMFLSPLAD